MSYNANGNYLNEFLKSWRDPIDQTQSIWPKVQSWKVQLL